MTLANLSPANFVFSQFLEYAKSFPTLDPFYMLYSLFELLLGRQETRYSQETKERPLWLPGAERKRWCLI